MTLSSPTYGSEFIMSIAIQITAGSDTDSSSVVQSGSIQQILTPEQAASFQLNGSNLINAVGTYSGQTPDNAYYCSPTPWGDLYTQEGWPQVQSLMTVQSATIVSVNASPSIVAHQTFSNTTSVPMECDANVEYSTTVGSSTTWSNSNSVSVTQSISYSVDFLGTGVEGETAMSYEHEWGTAQTDEESVTLGTGASVGFELPPGQTMVAELVTSQGTATVEVVYQMSLSGLIAANYSDPYQGHHFWGYDVNAVLSASNLPTVLTATETLVIDLYTDASIVLNDGSTMRVYPVTPKPGVRARAGAMGTRVELAPACA
jgi:hypothetical protein